MEIFDNGYLSEEEKSTINTQDLIYLAISNYTGEPIPEILPKNVYEYTLEKDGTIRRIQYQNADAKEGTDVLWDDFINSREPKNHFYVVFRPYTPFTSMDENGFIVPTTEKYSETPETIDLQMDFVGRNLPYKNIRPIYKNKAYFLTWVDDKEFLDTLQKFGGKAV